MKHRFIKKLLTMIIATTTIMSICSVGASASWVGQDTHMLYMRDYKYLTGWQVIDGKAYYFNEKGYRSYNGSDFINGKQYYFDQYGVANIKGWIEDNNGKWFYFNENGELLTNTTTPDGYNLDSDGSWIQNNTTNNVNSNNTTINNTNGIINNGSANNINVNNYYGNTNNNSNETKDTQNINLPFVMPTNWVKFNNTSYAINSRSPLIYQVKDTFGVNQNDIVVGLEEKFLEKTDLKYESKTYNGYKADCFEYLDVTQKGIQKFYNITIFNNDKVYNFTICGTKDNYETDKQDLENVLNSSLKF